MTLASLLALLTAALLLIALERRFPYDRGQPFLREGLWTDLIFYALLQSWVLAVAIGGLIAWIDQATSWSHRGLVSGWPVWAQVLFFVVTHDFYIYWFHRWQHTNRWLWRIHEAHHSVRQVDWLAGIRSHSLEILINQTIEFAPMILLGAAPAVPLLKGMISGIWGMYIHANLNVRTGRLQYVINGPEAHRWHHSTDLPPPGMSFGTKLAIWDLLFGTFYLPKDRKPSGYGLTHVDFPKGYLAQHLFAFRPFRRSRPGPESANETGPPSPGRA